MKSRIFLYLLFVLVPLSTQAADKFYLNFELEHPDGRLERGKSFSYSKPVTWSNGLKKSYVKLSCKEKKPGVYVRTFSTIDYFAGLRVINKVVDHNLEVEVLRQTVKPILEEVRTLPLNECKAMSPVVNTITDNYRFLAVDGLNEARLFGKDMTFRVKLKQLVKKR